MKYTNGLPDYYEMLHVSANASSSEIKKAFRHRAKEIHPDTGNSSAKTLSAMRNLIIAYETLINKNLRQEYDIHHRMACPSGEFNYRQFLQSRYSDPNSAAKLIFFDLLHEHEKEALDLYDTLVREKGFSLSSHLDREDFMDCTFLLAEKYEEEGKFMASFRLLKTLIVYELERPYFRHFFQEILDRMRTLLLRKMNIPIQQHIDCLQQIIRLPIRGREKTLYRKKVSELYLQYNTIKEAGEIWANFEKQV